MKLAILPDRDQPPEERHERETSLAQTLFIPKESDPSETRVAASAETVKKFIALGFDVEAYDNE